MSKEVRIGYWGSHLYPDLPMPQENTARPDQAEVIAKLKEAMKTGYMLQYRGWSNCRICGKHNGSKELEIIRGDTKFSIPEGYVHYLEDHAVGYDPELRSALQLSRDS